MPERDSSGAGSLVGRIYGGFLRILGIDPPRPHAKPLFKSPEELAREADEVEASWEFSSRIRAGEDKKEREEAEREQRRWKQALDDSREARAAEGDSHALLSLAIQDENLGNFERAIARYRQAAAAGRVGAMFKLGKLYAEGRGVTRDPLEAARWWLTAAELRHDASARCLGQLGLTRDQREEARRRGQATKTSGNDA